MKLKNLEHRSLWYKKIYYYLHAGQSLSDATKEAATDMDTQYIHQELQAGASFSSVCKLSEFKNIFTATEVSLIAVAEKTGNMKEVCQSLSVLLKSQYIQRQKLVAATIYPGLVLCMACGLLIMILTVIVPKIRPLFSGMKNLPVATKILMYLSNHVIHLWYIDIIIAIFFYCLHIGLRNSSQYHNLLRLIRTQLQQKTPYIKDMYMYWYIERWLHVMYMSLASKVALAEALSYAGESIDESTVRKGFLDVQTYVAEGNSCSASLSKLPSNIHKKIRDWISIIASGEQTGSLQDVFCVCHIHIQENLLESIDRFQKIIEPILIICVGIMVLAICLSILLPMYQLTQSLQ